MMGYVILVVVACAAAIAITVAGSGKRSKGGRPVTSAGRTRAGKGGKATRMAGGASPKPYPAVKVRSGRKACRGALAVGDHMILARDAPPLPLEGCDAEQCSCRYEHFDDRRQEDRRCLLLGNQRIIGDVSAGEKRRNDRRQFVD